MLAACGANATPTPTPLPIIGPDVAALRVGQNVRVRMRIECAEPAIRDRPAYLKPDCLYQGYLFRVALTPERARALEEQYRIPPEWYFVGKIVDVRGVVQRDGDWSEILVDKPDQFQIATGLIPAQEPTRTLSR